MLDKGPWGADVNEHGAIARHYVESADFRHDVRLYLDGDFHDEAEKSAYMKAIACHLSGQPGIRTKTLKQYREELGLTLRQVEELAFHKVSNSYLSQLENGFIKRPSLEVGIALAKVYKVSVYDIWAMIENTR